MSNIHGFGASKKPDDNKNLEEFSSVGHTSGTAVARPVHDPKGLVDHARSRVDATADQAQDRNIGVITLYSNGFIIGDGAFRDTKEPKNAAFLAQLRNGEVPAELEGECRKEWGNVDSVRVNLVDRTSQSYEAPKPKFEFSQSTGQSLSSSSSGSSSSFSGAVTREYKMGDADKKTTLQLVLHPRERVRAEFSQDATVMQLYEHIMFLSKQSKFDLIAGFPPKPLSNPSATLKEAGLLGASVQQRLK